MKFLVTGFKPFGGNDINSSWETATQLGLQSLAGVDIVVKQLPVSFGRVGKQIRGLLEEIKPDVMV